MTTQRALELACKAHKTYLDADSADCGPIEDYISAVILEACLEEREIMAKEVGDCINSWFPKK